MSKVPRIARIILAEGATVTLPQPVGSRSSLDIVANKPVTLEWHPRGVAVWSPGMPRRVIVPDAHLKSVEEFIEKEDAISEPIPAEKRGPGRPPKEVAQH